MTVTISKNKHKSGISSERAYRIQRKLIDIVADIYSAAIIFKSTHDDILNNLTKRVYKTVEWKKAPSYVQSYVLGYLEARRSEINRYHLAWVLSCDGKLMTNKEVDELTAAERGIGYEDVVVHDGPTPWGRIDNDLSRHVWTDAHGNPMLDKPFDRKFKEI